MLLKDEGSLIFLLDGMQTVLTRVNTVTGVAYRDDPTILGWELINEPRCDADPTGAMVQVATYMINLSQ